MTELQRILLTKIAGGFRLQFDPHFNWRLVKDGRAYPVSKQTVESLRRRFWIERDPAGDPRALTCFWQLTQDGKDAIKRTSSDALKEKVMAARAAYRATLDPTGHGSEEAYAAMEAAEAEWDAAGGGSL